MSLIRHILTFLTITLGFWIIQVAPVSSQEPDIREIRPAVMLLVDTSGSMNYDVRSGSSLTSGAYPTCTGNATPGSTRNRWIALIEALTGTFDGYYCTQVDRRRAYPGDADQFYFMPNFIPGGTQASNGILDVYRDRVKFGLMTLDPVYGLERAGGTLLYLVPNPVYTARITDITGALGAYSYGSARPISFPGCGTAYSVNGGVRRAASSSESFAGSLISVGTDATSHLITNAQVQSSLLSVRPYGGSAVDAMMQDFSEWILGDPDVANGSDPLAACRDRYAILISDGDFDSIYRDIGCGAPGQVCPYRLPTSTVADLCAWDGFQCTGAIDGLYTVGYAVSSATGLANLNDLASVGGTGSAYTAESTTDLLDRLGTVLNRSATGTTTRTVTAYAAGSSLFTGSTVPQQQYEFTTGFRIGTSGAPWTGILERTRYTCTSPGAPPNREPLISSDRFQDVLNARDLTARPRRLLTVAAVNPGDSDGVLIGDILPYDMITPSTTRGSTRETGLSLTPITTTSTFLTPAYFGFSTGSPTERTAARNAVINWIHGVSRSGSRLSDIYHSSPVVVSPPRADVPDESFNLFRRRVEVAQRPTVLYVGTNDGVMHAFAIEDHAVVPFVNLGAGEEIWGFVPPTLLDRLQYASASHQIMVDATPVVRDVFFQRRPGDLPSADSYHTVLIGGLRAGGNHYFALDVTDPLNPKFLWQFTRPEMGESYGRPGIAQVFVNIDGVAEERAVAIIPGGRGQLSLAPRVGGIPGCTVSVGGTPQLLPDGFTVRSRRGCWSGSVGRSLYVVDIATGEVIREFLSDIVPSPMSGGVSTFLGETGSIATRAYVTDADGVMWRLNLSSRDSSAWTLDPLHDVYWSDGAEEGHDSQDPPIISTNSSGDVVVIVGTGNVDDLEGSEKYRVASITDRVSYTSTGMPTFNPVLNWEIRLLPGEQVTGPMELFDGKVYFSTFSSSNNPTNLCAYGSSRIWGVSYIQSTTSAPPAGYTSITSIPFPTPGLIGPGSTSYDSYFTSTPPNTISTGVAIAQAPTCVSGSTTMDPYLGPRFQMMSAWGGDFRIVSQVSGSGGSTISTASSVATVSFSVPTPASVTRILAWAAQADF